MNGPTVDYGDRTATPDLAGITRAELPSARSVAGRIFPHIDLRAAQALVIAQWVHENGYYWPPGHNNPGGTEGSFGQAFTGRYNIGANGPEDPGSITFASLEGGVEAYARTYEAPNYFAARMQRTPDAIISAVAAIWDEADKSYAASWGALYRLFLPEVQALTTGGF